MEQQIIMAKNISEAKEIAFNKYGLLAEYIKPYKYASKGNNFYEFNIREKLDVLREIRNDISLNSDQKQTERILIITEFTKSQQAEMFRVLRKLVACNESTLHYHGSPYLKYLLDCANELFAPLDWDYEGYVMDSQDQPMITDKVTGHFTH